MRPIHISTQNTAIAVTSAVRAVKSSKANQATPEDVFIDAALPVIRSLTRVTLGLTQVKLASGVKAISKPLQSGTVPDAPIMNLDLVQTIESLKIVPKMLGVITGCLGVFNLGTEEFVTVLPPRRTTQAGLQPDPGRLTLSTLREIVVALTHGGEATPATRLAFRRSNPLPYARYDNVNALLDPDLWMPPNYGNADLLADLALVTAWLRNAKTEGLTFGRGTPASLVYGERNWRAPERQDIVVGQGASLGIRFDGRSQHHSAFTIEK